MNAHENYNSLVVRVDESDPTLLHVILDRTKDRKTLRVDFLDVLSQHTYKTSVDQRAVDVLRVMRDNPGLTRSEAVRRVAGKLDHQLRKRSRYLFEFLQSRYDKPRNRHKQFSSEYKERLRDSAMTVARAAKVEVQNVA